VGQLTIVPLVADTDDAAPAQLVTLMILLTNRRHL